MRRQSKAGRQAASRRKFLCRPDGCHVDALCLQQSGVICCRHATHSEVGDVYLMMISRAGIYRRAVGRPQALLSMMTTRGHFDGSALSPLLFRAPLDVVASFSIRVITTMRFRRSSTMPNADALEVAACLKIMKEY